MTLLCLCLYFIETQYRARIGCDRDTAAHGLKDKFFFVYGVDSHDYGIDQFLSVLYGRGARCRTLHLLQFVQNPRIARAESLLSYFLA